MSTHSVPDRPGRRVRGRPEVPGPTALTPTPANHTPLFLPRQAQLRVVALELVRMAVEASADEVTADTIADWYLEVAASKAYRALVANTASPAILVLIEVRELIRSTGSKRALHALDTTMTLLLGLPPKVSR